MTRGHSKTGQKVKFFFLRPPLSPPPAGGEDMEKIRAKIEIYNGLYHHIYHPVFYKDDFFGLIALQPFLYDLILKNEFFNLRLLQV